MKIDLKRKLTSRKFWFAVAGFGVGLYTIITQGCTAELISGLIMSFGSVAAYIIGEGIVDASDKNS